MKDNPNGPEKASTDTQNSLSLHDLLIDAESNELSDYLSLSISRAGSDTTVSVTTTDVVPTTYSAVLHGVQETDLQTLLADLQASSGNG
ncbi:MAG: type I secretion C-terminal target domain-containing protein [Gammaproteobacteria bacterium]